MKPEIGKKYYYRVGLGIQKGKISAITTYGTYLFGGGIFATEVAEGDIVAEVPERNWREKLTNWIF